MADLGIYEVVIIGSGPAGLTAAIYTARADLSPLCIEGVEAGGQLMTTTEVENYPGFEKGITGHELMEEMKKQAERFGTKFVQGDVTKVNFKSFPFELHISDKVIRAKAAIIATGASARYLGLESELRLRGRGVSACATCDGFFFRGKDVLIIGGGDSAMEEAGFLTKYASKVSIVHRRDQFRASKIMQDRIFANPKIDVIWDTVLEEVLGEEKVTGAKLRNVKSGEIKEIRCDGIFLAIGHDPNTSVFKDKVEMDEDGYIIISERSRTSVKGVFAAGDVADKTYRQAITAAGMGCRAALDATHYLDELSAG